MPADAETLYQKVADAVDQQETAGEVTPFFQEKLLQQVTTSSLAGRSPSEALQFIIEQIQLVRSLKNSAQARSLEAQKEAAASIWKTH